MREGFIGEAGTDDVDHDGLSTPPAAKVGLAPFSVRPSVRLVDLRRNGMRPP